jgi:hypothetical protein
MSSINNMSKHSFEEVDRTEGQQHLSKTPTQSLTNPASDSNFMFLSSNAQ